MNIVIIGQGAIGLLYYAFLSKSNQHQVSLLPSARCKELPTDFTFTSQDNTSRKIKLQHATNSILSCCDIILCCVKSYQVNDALLPIATILPPQASIILCHNGMGVYEELPKTLKNDFSIFSLLCTHGSKKNSAFNIVHTGLGHSDIGLIHSPQQEVLHQQTIEAFNNDLGELFWHNNIKQAQWLKLSVNCVINPITAIHNIDNGEVLQAKYRTQISDLLHEIVQVAEHEGISLNHEELQCLVTTVAKKTALNRSSMRSDVLAKRKTEIDYINGYIHRLGMKHKIATPENTDLWKRVAEK